MNTLINIDLQTVTARKLANNMIASGNASKTVAAAMDIAFAGKVMKANKTSLIHETLVLLIGDRNKHNAGLDKHIKTAGLNDAQAKEYKKENAFQGLNMMQTFASRWVKGQARFDSKRVSLKTTGKPADYSIALVSVSVPAGDNDKAKDASKKTSATKAKQLTNLMNDSSISLDEAIAALVDSYTLACVQAAVAKLS